jgi:DNA-binding helix-hairpin-helix protein with protein kinase domain
MPAYKDNSGTPIVLGSEIGKGGEGSVYEIPSNPKLVAKIYHGPIKPIHAEKLAAMVTTGTPDVLKVAAWPVSILQSNGKTVGLLMPKFDRSNKPIHELYGPKTRLREFPTANWGFLIHVATNMARGFAAVHNAGHIIGDVNHGNMLVSSKGTTAFIDCDSFQIRSNGRVFLCEVGVPTYTPPELQNRPFNSIQRTANHDAFGLAVLVFHLLFMGRHPFAGRFSGKGDMDIEKAISEFRFPFGRSAAQMMMSPPPNSLLLNQVSQAIANGFEKAFSPDAVKGIPRPTATEWLSILSQASKELTRCKTNPVHVFFSHLSSCPWCNIESRGIVLFVEFGPIFTTSLNVDQSWRKISSLPPLGVLRQITALHNQGLSVLPTPESEALGRQRRRRIGIGIITVIVTVLIAATLVPNGAVSLGLILGSIFFAYKFPQPLQKQKEIALGTFKSYQQRFQNLQNSYAAECSDQSFVSKSQELSQLRNQYNALPVERKRKLQQLEVNKYQLQLLRHLDKFGVQDAVISGIGPGRKQMLISYGVDSAADVTAASLDQVPNIGPKLAANILAWRTRLERTFKFDASEPVDKKEIEKIDRELRAKSRQLEQSVSRCAQEAAVSHATILAKRKTYLDQLESAVRQLAQAEENHKAS